MHHTMIACKDGTRKCCKQNHHPWRDAFPCGILEQCKGRNRAEHFLCQDPKTCQPSEDLPSGDWEIGGSYGDAICSIHGLEYADMDDDVSTYKLLAIVKIVAGSVWDAARQNSGVESSNDEPDEASLMFYSITAALDVLQAYMSTMDCARNWRDLISDSWEKCLC